MVVMALPVGSHNQILSLLVERQVCLLVAFFGDAVISHTLKFNLHRNLFSASLVGREIEISKGKKKERN